MFAQVPIPKRAVDDPDGTIYQDRKTAYESQLVALSSSAEFDKDLRTELSSRGVPELPQMGFTPGSYTSSSSDQTAASGEVIAIILAAGLVVGVLLYCCVQYKRNPTFRRRCRVVCVCVCPCCCRREAPKIASSPSRELEDQKVKAAGGPFCVCGQPMIPDADRCHKCGRTPADVARERYIDSKTNEELEQGLGAALDAFDQPRKPDRTLGRQQTGVSVASSFLDMVGESAILTRTEKTIHGYRESRHEYDESTNHSSYLTRQGTGVSAISGTSGTSHKRKHKYFGDDRPNMKPLRKEADTLRQAMGGEAHHHKSKEFDPTLSQATTSATATQNGTKDAEASRMIQSLHAYNAVDPDSPTKKGVWNQINTARPISPETGSTSSSDDMEMVDVTDSSGDDD